MRKGILPLLIGLVLFSLFLATQAHAQQVWIRDIIGTPDRYWNKTVTIIGEVQDAQASPAGTTRGDYYLVDDSTTERIAVRTRDLPAVGKTFAVTGVVFQDQATGATLIREIKRTTPGFPEWLKLLLIGGAVLFLVLLIIFIFLLVKPKGVARTPTVSRPTYRPMAPPPMPPAPPSMPQEASKTRKVETAPTPSPEPDKTRAFLSLRAELLVEKGPDQGKSHALHKMVTTIGRAGARKNDLELGDDTVSKEQASVFYDNAAKQFSITNESTTNPTHVNKKVIMAATILNDNDVIEAGSTIIRFKKE